MSAHPTHTVPSADMNSSTMHGDSAVPAVDIQGVGKIFQRPGHEDVIALEPTNLSVDSGEFVVLLGPSGCGKTTLLRLIAGLSQPTSGELFLHGKSAKRAGLGSGSDEAEYQLGMVFQEANLFPWLTIEENVALPLELKGVKRRVRMSRARELCELVGLQGFENRRPRELSGGMQQRASIARALSADPGTLLMDEPFGALDAFTRDKLNLELQRIWMETNKTVVLVTHSIGEGIFLADRLVLLSPRPGRVVSVRDVTFPRTRELSIQAVPEFQQMILDTRKQLGEDI